MRGLGQRYVVSMALILAATTILSSSAMAASSSKRIGLPGVTSIESALEKSMTLESLPKQLVGQLSGEANSMYWGSGTCGASQPGGSSSATECVLGDVQAQTSVVLYGDSFALQWAPSFSALGLKDHFKVVMFSRLGCPFADVKIVDWEGSVDAGCLPFRQNVVSAINSMTPSPALVVLSEETDVNVPVASWTEGIKKTIQQLDQSKFPIDVMFGEADAGTPPSACLARYSSHITQCSTTAKTALKDLDYPQTASAALSVHAGLINTSPLFCFDKICPDIVANTLVHSDSWHIDKTFAAITTPALASLIGCTDYQFQKTSAADRALFKGLLATLGTPGARSACAESFDANGV